MKLEYAIIPVHCRESVREYIENGRPMGGFLTLVFSNDLAAAALKADHLNASSMRQYAKFLYNVPRNVWGSREIVDAWIKTKREEREAANDSDV